MKKTILLLFIIVMLVCGLIMFTACSSAENINAESSVNTNDNTNDNSSNGYPAVNDGSIYIGEAVENYQAIEFVVTEVRDSQNVGILSTSYNFVVVTIQMTNKSDNSWFINSSNFKLQQNGINYDNHNATYQASNWTSNPYLYPDETRTLSIVFETPSKSSVNVCTLLIADYYTAKKTIVLKNRQ